MEHSSEFENPNSAAAGVYRQNAFYIRMSSLFDLEPSDGEPPAVAVAMHAHEYVHFLHNASTTAGQAYLLSNLTLLRALAAGSDDQGYFIGIDSMADKQRKRLHNATTLMRAQLGTTGAKQLATCKDVCHWECSAPQITKSEGIPTVITVFKARDPAGEYRSQDVAIGFSFITEGVAYEIEREMRRFGGTPDHDLDKQTSVFPYLAYRVLLQSWSGRVLTAHDCIAIGVSALTHTFSGYWLATICLALKETKLSLDEVLTKARASTRIESERILAVLREHPRDMRKGDAIWIAMGEYLKLAEAGVQLRQKFWAPEFAFLSGKLTAETLKQRISSMVDCQIIQCKPDGTLDIYWHGPGLVAHTDQVASCLGALQSALHFSQLHLTAEGSAVPTTVLKSRSIPCPFAGGCTIEQADQYPQECRSSPWLRFAIAHPGEPICPYAAGVKALRNSPHASRPSG